MLHAGLDLSRRRLDYCLLDECGERLEEAVAAPDADGLRGLAGRIERRHGPVVVRAAIESMNGARFVHDTLEAHDPDECPYHENQPRAGSHADQGLDASAHLRCRSA